MTCSDTSWGQNPELLGPLGIDYEYLHECAFSDLSVLFFIIAFCWVCFLMNILANTASNYFSPTLGKISDKLDLSLDIAGVTFLAFGNGAPDFFSLIASFSGGVDVLVGVGALLGGSVFVCTVVVGSIAILCPCEVVREVFLRDVSFHLIATTCVMIVAILREINFYMAFALLGVYGIYVIVVMNLSRWVNGGAGSVSLRTLSNTDPGIPMTKMAHSEHSVQTAFWHRSVDQKTPKTNSFRFNKPTATASTGGYSFSTIRGFDPDEDVTDRAKDVLDHPRHQDSGSDSDNDEEVTINLSGGFMPEFSDIICEDYVQQQMKNSTPYIAGDDNSNGYDQLPYSIEEDNIELGHMSEESGGSGNGLNQSLLGDGDHSSRPRTLNSVRLPVSTGMKHKSTNYQKAIKSLYWQQWKLRKGFHKSIFKTDWSSMSWIQRILFVVELPVTLLRDLTIPTLEDDNWYKLYAIIHPMADAIFAAFLFGYITYSVSSITIVLLCIVVGIVPSVCIFLLTHHNKAPNGWLFSTLWSLTAFAMCILWIYMLAGELIACLSALGVILKLPPAFLGLTVLAWGNSVGDLFTNTAVAKQGLGEMAIAGCYGGPVFNILMGFGVSLIYACSKSYPKPFSVHLDASSIVSIVFLFIALSSTMLLVSIRNYSIERWFGYYLLFVYAMYTLTQFIVLIFFS